MGNLPADTDEEALSFVAASARCIMLHSHQQHILSVECLLALLSIFVWLRL